MSESNKSGGSKKNGKTIKIGKKKIHVKKAVKQDRSANRATTADDQLGNQNKKKRTKGTIIKRVVLVVFSLCVIGFLVGMGFAVMWMIDAPELDLSKFTFTSSTVIYDINGDYYQQLQTTESRTPVEIEEIPQIVQLAFISIEDQRFYAHKGVDVRGTLKAVFNVISSGSTDGPGGSTLTQQLIKNTHLTSETSIERKVKEWKLAFQLENALSKDEILEAYLNQVNMSVTWGIQNAANHYFGCDVSELSIAQSAVLASIIKAPYYYNPYDYDKDENDEWYLVRYKDDDGKTVIGYDSDNQARAIQVVEKMYELGHINQQEYEIAKNELENNLIGLQVPNNSSTYTYFTDAVYEQVLDDIMETYNYSYDAAENLLLNGGLKIYSTVDPAVQSALEEQAADDDNFPAQSSTAKKATAAAREVTGDDTINYIPQLGGVVIENKTGYVVGIIGGREKTGSLTLNRALQSYQIGSTTKPLTVYGAGIDAGVLTMGTTFDNMPLNFGSWKVVNTPSTYTGMTTCREGIKESINIVAVLAQKQVGVDISADYGERFGLTITRTGEMNDMNTAALALGGYTYGQTPLQVADAYTVFPNGGYRVTPTFYTTVEDSNGNVILTAEQETVQVLDEGTAFIVTTALQQVVRGGTTTRSVPGQEMGGKTGTTDNEYCTWFTGFTPEYTASFWWGYDEHFVKADGKTYELIIDMGGGGTDSPAQYWEKVFRQFYDEKDLPNAKLPSRPDNVISAPIDSVSGLAPTELTSQDPRGSTIYSEYFLAGTYPAASDDMHVLVTICNDTGLLAGPYCTNTTTQVMIDKSPEIVAWPDGARLRTANYVAPGEKGFIAPTEVCTLHTEANSVTGFEFSTSHGTNDIVSSITIEVGSTQNLYLKTVSYLGVQNLTTETPTYVSNDEGIATVSKSGNGIVIEGISEGTATITASYAYNPTYTITKTITINVVAAEEPPPAEDPPPETP